MCAQVRTFAVCAGGLVTTAGALAEPFAEAQMMNAAGGVAHAPVSFAPPATPASACLAPGADAAAADAALRAIWGDEPGDPSRYFINNRWSFTATAGANVGDFGDPLTLTYSYPPDGLSVTGSSLFTTTTNVLNAKLAEWFGSVSAGRALIRSALDRWESLSGLRFVEVADDGGTWGLPGQIGARGDIRFASVTIDGPGGILALTWLPNGGRVVFDAGDNFGISTANNFQYFRNTTSHEVGHAWGALHVCPVTATKLMEPFLSLAFDGPQHDDIRGVQAAYGPVDAGNGSAQAAVSLGALAAAPTVLENRSAYGIRESWWRVTLVRRSFLSGVVTPVGFTYDNAPQAGAVCTAGNVINSAAISRLLLTFFRSDGVTQVSEGNAPLLGQPAVASPVIADAGDYLVRVRGVNAQFLTQLFSLSLRAPQAVCPGDLTGDGAVTFADLSLVLNDYGTSGPNLPGDVNGDGKVDFIDLSSVVSNYGQACPP